MTDLPWLRPRHELLLLALVAVAALSPVYVVSTQDVTRLCLTRALVQGHLEIQPCAGNTIDQASFDNRNYSDKAPGFSAVAIPAALATGLRTASRWHSDGDRRLWGVRVLTSGLAFILLIFAVGRVSEGIAPGYGGLALVTFALGTYAGPLAATSFDHDLAAAFGFGAFVLAWSRRFAAAGLLAGCAVTTNYTTALIGIVLAAYVVRFGVRRLLRFALGAAAPLLLLGAYDWAAFASPFHLSYRYVANEFAREQTSGFFGLHAPRLHGVDLVFLGEKGVLIAAPVLVAAAAGLVLLRRRYPWEAVTCAVVAALFVLANCGYFMPYGGISPGPRFLVPALPFLALGLAPAFMRWWRPTLALAVVSLVAMTTLTLTWAGTHDRSYRQTVWGELVRFSRLHDELAKNVVVWNGTSRLVPAAIVFAAGAAALAVAAKGR